MKLTKVIGKLSVVIISVFLALVLIEVFLRIVGYERKEVETLILRRQRPFLYTTHTKRIYSLNENFLNEKGIFDNYWMPDNLGFRFNPSHSEGFIDSVSEVIVAVGDSFTYGHGVAHDQAYPAVLEDLLIKKGRNVIVHNAGVPGYGLDQEYIYIKDEIIPNYKPDIIIWNINANNDYSDTNEKCLFTRKFNNYFQVPSWFNSFFYKGLISEKTPNSVLSYSLIVDALLHFNETRANKLTIGCSRQYNKYHDEVESEVNNKLVFFIDQLADITNNSNTKVIFSLTPFQYYFDKQVGNNNSYFKNYQSFKKTLSSNGENVIDVNIQIAKSASPSLLAIRGEGGELPLPESEAVLGYSSDRLNKTLFLESDNFEYGNQHLSIEGNRAFAEVVSNFILLTF
jgi:hypothetical protein